MRIVSPDLYVPNESLLLGGDHLLNHAPQTSPLAAVTYVATKQKPTDELSALVDACRPHVEKALYDRRDGRKVTMFVADGPWQPSTLLMKKKRLWGRRPWAGDAARFSSLSSEVEIQREQGIRYAGLATVTRQGFGPSLQVVRTDHACALLFRDSAAASDAGSIAAIFSAAFPRIKEVETASIDWGSLALFACKMGDIVVRVSGEFDDASAAIDLIFDPTRHEASSL